MIQVKALTSLVITLQIRFGFNVYTSAKFAYNTYLCAGELLLPFETASERYNGNFESDDECAAH